MDLDKDTWFYSWDHKIGGWVSNEAMLRLAQKIGMLGPLAAAMGRHLGMFC